ncbi:enoyl-CoA delta isomerase 1, mitochondrial-like [Daktulosphaira vitifoliae]|uniref:enoyl-CoA delta isomerase 1, mitochondrial-like n=1 Tax=Daktulosphaira vitifoliae TaxID=58002 RepID=UPI0021AA6C00|nr:enoyl-CoA delta isomerase 1, mitochondrial-like [Daktulosphaira vitifoliae]
MSLLVIKDDHFNTVTVKLNKSPVNTLNLEFLEEIKALIIKLKNEDCRGMILTSSLANIFSAGLDINELHKPNPTRLEKFWTTLQDIWLELYLSPFPTVAVINGHSPAGGCLLAMSCDYRVMVESKFKIGLNETQIGIVAPKWFQDTMVAVVGQRNAEVALTTGKLYIANEALKIGLVDEIALDTDKAMEKGKQFLNNFQKIPSWAYKKSKEMIRQPIVQWLIDNKNQDLEFFMGYMQSPAIQKNIDVYLQSLKK